ncbi:MAG: hypothetical protein AAFN18_14355 [Cyanobacteria bacterium J06554_6]
MLDIGFFNDSKQPLHRVSVAEDFLFWLAKTDFSAIGEDESTEARIDGDTVSLPLVLLHQPVRQAFIQFFNEAIVAETRQVLHQLESATPAPERVYRLKQLIALLDCLKNEDYRYLRRL